MRVVALSGGYSRGEAVDLLTRNKGMIASYSRALLQGLKVDQSEEDFNERLSKSIIEIFEASIT
jgi:fructose-bisphosphate aldolase class I